MTEKQSSYYIFWHTWEQGLLIVVLTLVVAVLSMKEHVVNVPEPW